MFAVNSWFRGEKFIGLHVFCYMMVMRDNQVTGNILAVTSRQMSYFEAQSSQDANWGRIRKA